MQRLLNILFFSFVVFTACVADSMMNKSDLTGILQQVVNAKQLSEYYHADVLPERIPLRLLENEWIDKEIALTALGRRVEILSKSDADVPYLEISNVEISGESARVSFRYPPEGLVGIAELSRSDEHWVLDSMTLHER
jgi:hypothetical protein